MPAGRQRQPCYRGTVQTHGRVPSWLRPRVNLALSLSSGPCLANTNPTCSCPDTKCNRIIPGPGQLIRHVSEIYIARKALRPDQRYRPHYRTTPSSSRTEGSPTPSPCRMPSAVCRLPSVALPATHCHLHSTHRSRHLCTSLCIQQAVRPSGLHAIQRPPPAPQQEPSRIE
ncbi:hypothetical protein BS50DRAFT_3236 [Corynespora cassiicola Philippines]|uniref:Uncharacterized protein n=1 Tax=Corynespora cassiicola Philippines TaxID=1448308 RepID=A0A2T2P951_CORCC|nr:hypothetical protein BS50DRAFT_3236 [Corynespora cassiicola Philippines]